MYKVGEVYTWQHQQGDFAYLNGTDTMVTGGPFELSVPTVGKVVAWRTDSAVPEQFYPKYTVVFAGVGDLRPKGLPTGEQLVMGWFEVTPVMKETM